VDREIVRNVLKEKRLLLKKEKRLFLNEKIAGAEGKKSLFSSVDSFLINKPGLKHPRQTTTSFDSLSELVLERFSNHFLKKVTDSRTSLDSASCSLTTEVPRNIPPFSYFDCVSVAEITSLIKESPSKSSLRDPIPTSLLKQFVDVLAIAIISIVNLSLSFGVFPDEMKLAFVTPLLKRPNLLSMTCYWRWTGAILPFWPFLAIARLFIPSTT
jgi:hypothetical protein